MLLAKAKFFAQEFGHEATPTMSWIERFKKRHGIDLIQKAGEAAGVNNEVVEDWKHGKLEDVLRRYDARDIYNADETGLFWQMLPEKSLGFLGKTYHGTKQPKTRITVLVCANMDGSDKLPLFVISKSKYLRAFKNVMKLPVSYEANKKAWMTGTLFEGWLRKLDGDMGMEGRQVAMIIDNCPAHPVIELENIELVFLPPNTTSVTQPMDGGIIRNLKQHYRHILASRRLAAAENDEPFQWNLLDAIQAVKSAWRKVTKQTIVNVYRKVGFVAEQNSQDDVEVSREEETSDVTERQEFRSIWERLSDPCGELPSLDEYIAIDDNDECCEVLTDSELVAFFTKTPEEPAETEADDDLETEEPPPTLRAVFKAVDLIRRYNMNTECPDDFSIFMDRYESFLMREMPKHLKQSAITDFFKTT